MSAKSKPRSRRGAKNVDIRHQVGIVAFGIFALVIVLLVFFPQLRPNLEKPGQRGDGAERQRLMVLAASSLTEPLIAAGRAYESSHPEWKLDLSFAASNTLQRQVENGAPADLFLSASAAPVEALVGDGWVMRDQVFVMWTTGLVVLGPREDEETAPPSSDDSDGEGRTSAEPDGMDPAAALRDAQRIAIGDVGVPVGEYARAALRSLGLLDELQGKLIPLPNEAAVVQAVATGACDRGLAYASSVRGDEPSPRVRALSVFPAGSHPPITYYAVIPASSPNVQAVTDFLLYLTAGDGATILEGAGFGAPVAPVHSLDQP
jgi:molybdate transport system substrate-binding protein